MGTPYIKTLSNQKVKDKVDIVIRLQESSAFIYPINKPVDHIIMRKPLALILAIITVVSVFTISEMNMDHYMYLSGAHSNDAMFIFTDADVHLSIWLGIVSLILCFFMGCTDARVVIYKK